MKIIVLHVEESHDAMTFYGEAADILEALGDQHFGGGRAKKFLDDLAGIARGIEEIAQCQQVLRRTLRRIK